MGNPGDPEIKISARKNSENWDPIVLKFFAGFPLLILFLTIKKVTLLLQSYKVQKTIVTMVMTIVTIVLRFYRVNNSAVFQNSAIIWETPIKTCSKITALFQNPPLTLWWRWWWIQSPHFRFLPTNCQKASAVGFGTVRWFWNRF